MVEANVTERAGTAVVELRGRIDADADAALGRAWTDADALGTTAVLLTFDAVEYINSTGIALVVGLLAKARAAGKQMLASGLSEHYRHIFEITRLADLMTFYADVEAAVAARA